MVLFFYAVHGDVNFQTDMNKYWWNTNMGKVKASEQSFYVGIQMFITFSKLLKRFKKSHLGLKSFTILLLLNTWCMPNVICLQIYPFIVFRVNQLLDNNFIPF